MASPLPPEQQASYSAIIDDILANSDLNTISAKAIRKGLQDKVDYDLNPQKGAIKALIMERFDRAQSRVHDNGSVEPPPTTNGASHVKEDPTNESTPPTPNKRKAPEEDEETSDVEDGSPAQKKLKKSKGPKSAVETDEQLAARLHAEINGGTSARATRGGGAKRKTPAKKEKKSKKKTPSKLGAADDSDLDGSGSEKPEKEKKGGFHKPMNLSEPLSALLGASQLSRPQTVKKIWEYVKSRDLQDPADKRQIVCDEPMRAVFKGDKIHMFTMNKVLAHHLYPVEDVVE